MEESVNVSTVLEFFIEMDEGRLSKEVFERLEPHLGGFDPSLIKVPWPLQALPRPGDDIYLCDLEGKVSRVIHFMDKDLLETIISVVPREVTKEHFVIQNDKMVADLASCGATLDDRMPMKRFVPRSARFSKKE